MITLSDDELRCILLMSRNSLDEHPTSLLEKVIEELWIRNEVKLDIWPVIKPRQNYLISENGYHIVSMCHRSKDIGDKNHQPKSYISKKAFGDDTITDFPELVLKCSCGDLSSFDSKFEDRCQGRIQRQRIGDWWWPVEMGDTEGFIQFICPNANSIDDPKHALYTLGSLGFSCICDLTGRSIDELISIATVHTM